MPSPQQSTAATNIRNAFRQRRVRYALLKAECQSGKTGAYHALIRLMRHHGDIQRAYILCGANDTTLRTQATCDARNENPDDFATGRLQVIFRQDFNKHTLDLRHALIVHDESHLTQDIDMELDQFLTLNGLTGVTATGDPSVLETTDTYYLSVSATPYSELSSIAYSQYKHKHVEILAPGEGYVGIRHYIDSGLVGDTYSIVDDERAFGQLVESIGCKYFLMRLSASKDREAVMAVIQRVYHRVGGKVFYHDSKHEPHISVDALRDAPDCPTIVLLDGMLRVGKVVPKIHIGCVWENSKAPNTDVIVQGLLGRMCGYPLSTTNPCGIGATLPRIFLPERLTTHRPNKVVPQSEIERAIMNPLEVIPSTGANLKKGVVANKSEHFSRELGECTVQCSASLLSVPMQLRIPATNGHSIFDPRVTSCVSPMQTTAACGTLTKAVATGSAKCKLHYKEMHANLGATIPKCTRKVVRTKIAIDKTGRVKYQCTPLLLQCTSEDWSFSDAYQKEYPRKAIKQKCIGLLRSNMQLVRDSKHYTPEQKGEILQAIGNDRPPSIRLMHAGTSSSQLSYFKRLQAAHRMGKAPSEDISDFPPVCFVVPYKDITTTSPRHVYAIFYTYACARNDLHETSVQVDKSPSGMVSDVSESPIATLQVAAPVYETATLGALRVAYPVPDAGIIPCEEHDTPIDCNRMDADALD
jgi:hypothetical protein